MSFKDDLLASAQHTKKAARIKQAGQRKPRRLVEILPKPSFYINQLPLFSALPPETKRWIRDASDERAAIEYGCRFQESRGQYTVNWIESNCVLYEGDAAGQYMSVEDWQYELYMRGWGWLWFSEDWAVKTGLQDKGWVRRYRKINGWVPKKNTKSPTLAAAGLHTLMADGERGQKCFSVAKDVNQALVSHTHALEFVRQNPKLASLCRINKTTSEIYYAATRSKYVIRTGSNGANRDRNEGLNGSLFIDETHVVDENQMSVLRGAGISRRQFLHMQLSTAGSNTAGYGFKECEAGRQNLLQAEQGLDFNFRFLHLEYAIPPDTSLDEIRDSSKIEGLIRSSNPTLGRIVIHDEIIQDWRESRASDTELTRFAMYRLNQWNTGGGAYIAGSDWKKCHKKFLLRDLKELPCVIGGDFSRRRDMTALVLAFAVPTIVDVPVDQFDPDCVEYEEKEINVPHTVPYFFIPERAVALYSRHINLKEFADLGLLTITKGATIRAQEIAQKINWADQTFQIRKVGTDAYYAKDVAAILDSEYGWDVDERFGLISQTAANIGPAVEQLYNCVLNKEIVHNNNAVLNWQLSNVTVMEDNNGNRRFEKPKADDYRKIDGWSALANAIYLMMSEADLYPGQVTSISLGRD